MSAEPLARLRDLLEEERRVLGRADLEMLNGILARKEHLVGAIRSHARMEDTAEVRALRDAAARNAELAEAARRGVRAAIERLAERARVARQFDTYDKTGRRRTIAAPSRAAPRRA